MDPDLTRFGRNEAAVRADVGHVFPLGPRVPLVLVDCCPQIIKLLHHLLHSRGVWNSLSQ